MRKRAASTRTHTQSVSCYSCRALLPGSSAVSDDEDDSDDVAGDEADDEVDVEREAICDHENAECVDGSAEPSTLRVARSSTPLNDYDGCAAALYGAFWSHFPLHRGLGATCVCPLSLFLPRFGCTGEKVTSDVLVRLLFFHDNRYSVTGLPFWCAARFLMVRFATNLELIVQLASTARRHATNKSVNLRQQVDPLQFEELVELVNSSEFVELLREAETNPEVRPARCSSLCVLACLCGCLDTRCVARGSRRRRSSLWRRFFAS